MKNNFQRNQFFLCDFSFDFGFSFYGFDLL